MPKRPSNLLQPASLLRLATDAVLIQVAVVVALVTRYLIVYVFQNSQGTANLRQIASDYVAIWVTRSWLLTLLCLICLGIAGVYTRRRFYMGRYKALAVLQSVTVAFLAYAAVGYFLHRSEAPNGANVVSNQLRNLTAEVDQLDALIKQSQSAGQEVSSDQLDARSSLITQQAELQKQLESQRKISDFPIGAFAITYGLSIALLIGARTFNRVWQRFGEDGARTTSVAEIDQDIDNRVLVIGGAGYIGSALVPQLLDAGYHVRVLDAMLFGEEPLAPVKDHDRLEILRADFRSGLLGRAMRNVGTVVHLAGIVGDPACNLDEGLTVDVNLTSTRSIADQAKYSNVKRFVFASTCSVYGACDEMLDERSMAKPVSLYGNTKLASEKVLTEMADDNFSPTILRFATIYGLSGRTRVDLVVNLLAAKAKVDGKITVFNGSQWRPFVHVMDAARAIKAAVEAPQEAVHNEVFNVGSNEQNHTILEVGEMIHEQVIGAQLLVDNSGTDARNYRVDFTKIQECLGFEPQWTIEKGIEQVLHAIASGKVTDYHDPKYSNYAFLNLQGTTELARDHWALEMIRDLEEGI